jgi:hypothetical protein
MPLVPNLQIGALELPGIGHALAQIGQYLARAARSRCHGQPCCTSGPYDVSPMCAMCDIHAESVETDMLHSRTPGMEAHDQGHRNHGASDTTNEGSLVGHLHHLNWRGLRANSACLLHIPAGTGRFQHPGHAEAQVGMISSDTWPR